MPSKRKSLSKAESAKLLPTMHNHPPRKLIRRFYEPLVLQYVLDPTRGNRIHFELLDSLDGTELDDCKLRCSFTNSLAYVCDFDTRGITVTAIALQSRPEGEVFWVAANGNVKNKVVQFLERILETLAGLDGSPEDSTTIMTVFRPAVELGMPRVKAYWQFMQEPLRKCLMILEGQQNKGELYEFLLVVDSKITCDTPSKGVPEMESQTGGRLVSPSAGHEKKNRKPPQPSKNMH